MGNSIRQIFKGIVKQTPDVVEQVSRTAPGFIHDIQPEIIARAPNIRLSPALPTVFPIKTVTNRLGVPMGIGNNISFDNGQLTGTLFSGNRRYDLSKIYDDFQRKGVDRRFLGNWMYSLDNNIEEIVRRLPLTDNFQPNLDFIAHSPYHTANYTPEQYRDLMRSSGYNESAIEDLFGQAAGRYILNGQSVPSWLLNLNYNHGRFAPNAITEYTFTQFRPEHIIQNMTEPIAQNVFIKSLQDTFNSSFDKDLNIPIFTFTPPPIDDVRIAASNILSAKHPELNFDPSLIQFKPENSANNIPTINWLRTIRKYGLPFDFNNFSWFQGKIRPKDWGTRDLQPNVGMDVYKTMGKLKEHVPRGYAITEMSTSPDSEALKLAMVSRNYGTGPGQTSVQIINSNGRRNNLQNNALWFEDLLNDPNIPQHEVTKLQEIMANHGLKGEISPEWYNSETYKRAQFLYNQMAVKDMFKLYKGWHRIKKLDPSIDGFNISVNPFSPELFNDLLQVGNVAPYLYSPDFHIIKHKNGGKLLKSLNDAINKLKNNNKFGN